MKERGHRIIRYADDILILCQSKRAAINALTKASSYLEGDLLLTVNREKTHITHSWKGVKFLGVSIHSTYTQIQKGKIKAFKAKVKAMTRRNVPVNLDAIIDDLNPILRGFAFYYRIANCSGVLQRLSSWIRRRLRAIQLRLWKKPRRLHRRLWQLCYTGEFDLIRMNSWANAGCPLSHYAIPNDCLYKDHWLFDISAVKIGISVSIWN